MIRSLLVAILLAVSIACSSPTAPSAVPVASVPVATPWRWDVLATAPGCFITPAPLPDLMMAEPTTTTKLDAGWLLTYANVGGLRHGTVVATFVSDPQLKAGSYALCAWTVA